jgi:hypothetical protein
LRKVCCVRGEQIGTRSKKPTRGMAKASIALIDAMYDIAEECQPITGRGVGYKLFSMGLIPSMACMKAAPNVYRLLKEARERGIIPWEWIVDETRSLEKVPSWDDPEHFARTVSRQYLRNFWNEQPVRVEVWSEKGTVRGVLSPVIDDEFGVGFRVMHGYTSATTVYDVAQDDDGRDLIVIYVGDRDPSGMDMSEKDLPARLAEYGGHHVTIKRIAILETDRRLPSFPASDKKKDPRYKWFVKNCGDRCWELDAMDPNDLRERVKEAIEAEIDPEAWERCKVINKAEMESLNEVLGKWKGPRKVTDLDGWGGWGS